MHDNLGIKTKKSIFVLKYKKIVYQCQKEIKKNSILTNST